MVKSYWCVRCSMALGTTLCFDSEADIRAHTVSSQLHSIVASASRVKMVTEFVKVFEKPRSETGSDFSLTTEIQFETWLKSQETASQ